jgi:CHAT domain-containing protein
MHHEHAVTEAEALRYAMQELRKVPKWLNPLFWGAFQVIGSPI